MSRRSSATVTGLTAAALAVVGFLAYQASANVPAGLKAGAAPSASPSSSATASHGAPARNPLAVPAASGSGRRVVYELHDKRVWLVGADGKATRALSVVPSPVGPTPGSYTVGTRIPAEIGSDGVPIEHVVLFANIQGVTIGFSAARSGSTAAPDPSRKTGGIRMTRPDGDAVWSFATAGTRIVVVR